MRKILVNFLMVTVLFLTSCIPTGPRPYEHKPEIKTWKWSKNLTEDGCEVIFNRGNIEILDTGTTSRKAIRLCAPTKVECQINVEEGNYLNSEFTLRWMGVQESELLITIKDKKGEQNEFFDFANRKVNSFFIRPVEGEVTVSLEAKKGCSTLIEVNILQQMQMPEPELWGGKLFGKLVSFLVPPEVQKAARTDSLFFWGLLACWVLLFFVFNPFTTKISTILIGTTVYLTLAWVALMMRGEPETYTLGSLIAANLFMGTAIAGFLSARRR